MLDQRGGKVILVLEVLRFTGLVVTLEADSLGIAMAANVCRLRQLDDDQIALRLSLKSGQKVADLVHMTPDRRLRQFADFGSNPLNGDTLMWTTTERSRADRLVIHTENQEPAVRARETNSRVANLAGEVTLVVAPALE